MPELKTYRLFLSHAWNYHEDYDRLVTLLDKAPYFRYSNYSVPIDKKFDKMTKAQLQEELRDQIRPVQCVLVLAGMYVSYSDWIQFEIDFASSLGKPIVGVRPGGSERVPSAVTKAAIEVVGWNTDSIVTAIRKHSL